MEVMQTGIPSSRVLQPLPAADKLFQGVLPTACFAPRGVESITPEPGKPSSRYQGNSKCDSPG
jgi:hypothetical protein